MASKGRRFLLDLNVLIALTWPQHVHHSRAHTWFGGLVRDTWLTSPLTEAGFVRLSTNPRVVGRSVRFSDALAMLASLRSLPGYEFLPDGSSLSAPAIDLRRATASGQSTDLHLVNLAAHSDAALATLDTAIPEYLEFPDRRHVLVLP